MKVFILLWQAFFCVAQQCTDESNNCRDMASLCDNPEVQTVCPKTCGVCKDNTDTTCKCTDSVVYNNEVWYDCTCINIHKEFVKIDVIDKDPKYSVITANKRAHQTKTAISIGDLKSINNNGNDSSFSNDSESIFALESEASIRFLDSPMDSNYSQETISPSLQYISSQGIISSSVEENISINNIPREITNSKNLKNVNSSIINMSNNSIENILYDDHSSVDEISLGLFNKSSELGRQEEYSHYNLTEIVTKKHNESTKVERQEYLEDESNNSIEYKLGADYPSIDDLEISLGLFNKLAEFDNQKESLNYNIKENVTKLYDERQDNYSETELTPIPSISDIYPFIEIQVSGLKEKSDEIKSKDISSNERGIHPSGTGQLPMQKSVKHEHFIKPVIPETVSNVFNFKESDLKFKNLSENNIENKLPHQRFSELKMRFPNDVYSQMSLSNEQIKNDEIRSVSPASVETYVSNIESVFKKAIIKDLNNIKSTITAKLEHDLKDIKKVIAESPIGDLTHPDCFTERRSEDLNNILAPKETNPNNKSDSKVERNKIYKESLEYYIGLSDKNTNDKEITMPYDEVSDQIYNKSPEYYIGLSDKYTNNKEITRPYDEVSDQIYNKSTEYYIGLSDKNTNDKEITRPYDEVSDQIYNKSPEYFSPESDYNFDDKKNSLSFDELKLEGDEIYNDSPEHFVGFPEYHTDDKKVTKLYDEEESRIYKESTEYYVQLSDHTNDKRTTKSYDDVKRDQFYNESPKYSVGLSDHTDIKRTTISFDKLKEDKMYDKSPEYYDELPDYHTDDKEITSYDHIKANQIYSESPEYSVGLPDYHIDNRETSITDDAVEGDQIYNELLEYIESQKNYNDMDNYKYSKITEFTKKTGLPVDELLNMMVEDLHDESLNKNFVLGDNIMKKDDKFKKTLDSKKFQTVSKFEDIIGSKVNKLIPHMKSIRKEDNDESYISPTELPMFLYTTPSEIDPYPEANSKPISLNLSNESLSRTTMNFESAERTLSNTSKMYSSSNPLLFTKTPTIISESDTLNGSPINITLNTVGDEILLHFIEEPEDAKSISEEAKLRSQTNTISLNVEGDEILMHFVEEHENTKNIVEDTKLRNQYSSEYLSQLPLFSINRKQLGNSGTEVHNDYEDVIEASTSDTIKSQLSNISNIEDILVQNEEEKLFSDYYDYLKRSETGSDINILLPKDRPDIYGQITDEPKFSIINQPWISLEDDFNAIVINNTDIFTKMPNTKNLNSEPELPDDIPNSRRNELCMFLNTPKLLKANTLTPLMIAAAINEKECAEFLLDEGTDINEQDRLGETALMVAVLESNNEMIEYLLERGAKTNLTDVEGNNALMMSTWHNNAVAAELLLDYGADVNEPSQNGTTVTLQAMSDGNMKMVQLFLDAGAALNAEIQGRTLLLIALKNKDKVMGDTLVKAGADVNYISSMGVSPLLKAVKSSDEESAQFLLDHGANIDLKNHNDETALIGAVRWSKSTEMVKRLLSYCPDALILYNGQQTALNIAEQNNNTEVAELLRDYDKNGCDSSTPISYDYYYEVQDKLL